MRDSGEVCEIITLARVATAPEDLNDATTVGAYSNTDAADYQFETGYTLADVLAALRNPSDEYSLLTLRLFNGLHK